MTLRDKFLTDKSISTSGESARFARQCEKIADDYAVEFAEWLMINCDYQNHCVWEYKGIEYTNFELLEIFKKEKGL